MSIVVRDLGLGWHEAGYAALRGPLLDLFRECDEAFRRIAACAWDAEEELHPSFLPAIELERIDYLDSFPHLANFAVALADDDSNLDAFRSGPPLSGDGAVRLTRLGPVQELLTPAACYHLYVEHTGEEVGAARYLSTRNTCFRRETYYEPLRRQRCFEMREIVCLGGRDRVIAFLERTRALVDDLFRSLDLDIKWKTATDPFFRPDENPKHLFQQVHATKLEAVYADDLAVVSVNMHEDHFGSAFSITSDGEPASSGCVAFGLERWLFAITDRYGHDPADWPQPGAEK